MQVLTIKKGSLISPVNGYHGDIKDILVRDGVIAAVGDSIDPQGTVIDAQGCIVTPGFIDIHTHCYPKVSLGMEPDELGIRRGSTAILDAGSSGADNYEDFRENYIEKSGTKVFALLNLAKEGLAHGHELSNRKNIDIPGLKEILQKYPDNIVGLKARASASVVGAMGLEPIALAVKTAHEVGKPLMVHVGNRPPEFTEVLDLLQKNDIVTHSFHGKAGGILDEGKHVIPQALKARERGVLFDVGHGVASFSFRVFEQALKDGFDCDMISTDLHIENYNGPVYSLAAVVSKTINCGEELEHAVAKCTSVPARHFGLKGLGEIAVGMTADFNVMELMPCEETVLDSIGDSLKLKQKLVLKKTIYSRGNESAIMEHAIK